MARHIPGIGISMGDYNGVGPEVTLKALASLPQTIRSHVVLIGSPLVYQSLLESLSISIDLQLVASIDQSCPGGSSLCVYDPAAELPVNIQHGILTVESGRAAATALIAGINLAKTGQIDALVTAPINKKAFDLAGYHYPGQTEMLAKYTDTRQFAMMMISETFKLGLVTTHCAIADIAKQLSESLVSEKIGIVHKSLIDDFKIEKPTIAVTSLNPHCGDGGLFGHEEETIIAPAIETMRCEGINVHGPFAADSLFAAIKRSNYDAYIAMYHDQGMIPLKLMSFGRGVNFTAGLKIIRTSPDHGTAFDIAGKFIADAGSMKEAINLAYELVQKRIGSSTLQ